MFKNVCDRCGEWKYCHGYAGKLLLCDECAAIMKNDMIPDHYDETEGCDIMKLNLDSEDIKKDWERWHR